MSDQHLTNQNQSQGTSAGNPTAVVENPLGQSIGRDSLSVEVERGILPRVCAGDVPIEDAMRKHARPNSESDFLVIAGGGYRAVEAVYFATEVKAQGAESSACIITGDDRRYEEALGNTHAKEVLPDVSVLSLEGQGSGRITDELRKGKGLGLYDTIVVRDLDPSYFGDAQRMREFIRALVSRVKDGGTVIFRYSESADKAFTVSDCDENVLIAFDPTSTGEFQRWGRMEHLETAENGSVQTLAFRVNHWTRNVPRDTVRPSESRSGRGSADPANAVKTVV